MGWRNVVVVDHPGDVSDLLTEVGLNVVALGWSTPLAKAFGAGCALEPIVRGAFRNAFALGHRSVCYPQWESSPELVSRIRGWIADEYARAGLKYSPDFHAPIVEGNGIAPLHECLRAVLRHTPPTALVSDCARQWLATVGVAAAMDKHIPRDLSHIAMFQDDQWEALPVSQAHFDYPVTKMVNTVIKMLEAAKQGRPRRVAELPPKWVPGGTLTEPAR
jgi:DNA-binding LacI/PurR family transcriptional regulator